MSGDLGTAGRAACAGSCPGAAAGACADSKATPAVHANTARVVVVFNLFMAHLDIITSEDAEPSRSVASSLIAAVHQIDPKVAVSYEPLEATIRTDASDILTRVGGLVFAAHGAIGLVLASIGIYSMVGFAVTILGPNSWNGTSWRPIASLSEMPADRPTPVVRAVLPGPPA